MVFLVVPLALDSSFAFAGRAAFATGAAVALAERAAVRAAVRGAEAVGELVAAVAAAAVPGSVAAVSVACVQRAAGDAGNAAALERALVSASRSPIQDCYNPLAADSGRHSSGLSHTLLELNMGSLEGCNSWLPEQVNLAQGSAAEHIPR